MFVLKVIIPNYANSGVYTVYLFNSKENILLPVETNRWGCESVLLAKNKSTKCLRPHIHDTTRRIILALGGQVRHICVYKFMDGVFYTYIRLVKKNLIFDIDAKFTDALCLALREEVPVLVKKKVCNAAGIKVTRELIERSLSSEVF